jgi:hypothetical protein
MIEAWTYDRIPHCQNISAKVFWSYCQNFKKLKGREIERLAINFFFFLMKWVVIGSTNLVLVWFHKNKFKSIWSNFVLPYYYYAYYITFNNRICVTKIYLFFVSLMLSVIVWPKVITFSSVYCSFNKVYFPFFWHCRIWWNLTPSQTITY